jgi:hypothetical protein
MNEIATFHSPAIHHWRLSANNLNGDIGLASAALILKATRKITSNRQLPNGRP